MVNKFLVCAMGALLLTWCVGVDAMFKKKKSTVLVTTASGATASNYALMNVDDNWDDFPPTPLLIRQDGTHKEQRVGLMQRLQNWFDNYKARRRLTNRLASSRQWLKDFNR